MLEKNTEKEPLQGFLWIKSKGNQKKTNVKENRFLLRLYNFCARFKSKKR